MAFVYFICFCCCYCRVATKANEPAAKTNSWSYYFDFSFVFVVDSSFAFVGSLCAFFGSLFAFVGSLFAFVAGWICCCGWQLRATVVLLSLIKRWRHAVGVLGPNCRTIRKRAAMCCREVDRWSADGSTTRTQCQTWRGCLLLTGWLLTESISFLLHFSALAEERLLCRPTCVPELSEDNSETMSS